MTNESIRTVSYPTDETVKAEFTAYVNAVGRVAHAWNYLHERLGRLFVRILNAPDREVSAAVWYSPYSDRAQRLLLEDAIKASRDAKWNSLPTTAKSDLLEILRQVNTLGGKRDDAVHSPAILITDADGSQMSAPPLTRHRRAQSLSGKSLLIEFDYYEQWAEAISRYITAAENALSFGGYTWPDKPRKPDRRQRKTLLNP